MSRLIDADALIAKLEDDAKHMEDNIAIMFTYAAINDIKHEPTVDAVEVIHCEHCRHHENDSSLDSHWCFVWETFTDNHVYCSFAERRQDETD